MILVQIYLMVFMQNGQAKMGIQYRSNPIDHVLQLIKNINGLAIAVSENDFEQLQGSEIDHNGEIFTINMR